MGKNTESNKLLGVLLKDRESYEDMMAFINPEKFAKWLGHEELAKGITASYSNFAEKTQFTDKLYRKEMDDFVRMITKIINDSYEYPEQIFISYGIVFRKMQNTSLESLLEDTLTLDKDGNSPWLDIWTDRLSVDDAYVIYRFYIICACIKKFILSEQPNDSKRRSRESIIEDEAIYREDASRQSNTQLASDTQENEEAVQEESPEPEENRPVFKSDAEKELYQKFTSDAEYAHKMKFWVYDFASYICIAARERNEELKETLENVMIGAVSAIILNDDEKEAIAKVVLGKENYWDMCVNMMNIPIISDFVKKFTTPYRKVAEDLGMKLGDFEILVRHATMNAFFVKGGYFDETREEFKKKERHGQVLLNTVRSAQDSTQESNNCVPEEGQQQAAATANTDNAATEHDVVDEFVEYQTKLKAAKQTCESDIILNMSESSYLAMKALGFDYAVYKVMTRPADEKKKGDYRLNFSKAKRVLKLIVDYKHLPNVQGKFTDEQYANEMMFTKENLLVIMGENKFDDPEIELIIHEISHYYMDKAAENSTVTDEEATAVNTDDDISDEEDFMGVHEDDDSANNNVQVPAAGADDAIRFKIPEKFYKIAETIGLADEKLFETVNNERFFNFSYYKDSWGIVYDALKTGMMQVISENSLKRFENMLKGLFSDILKEYGYDENGNKIAGYAVSNNAPLAVHEPVASYGTNETSEDEEDVVEDDDEFDENETEEEEVRPGFKEIHVTLNGKKITVPPRRKDRGGAYHDVTELFDYTLKEEDRHDKVLKLFVKINGKVVRGREEWQKACAVIREGDVIEFAYKVVE